MAEAKVRHTTHQMEEACEQACVIIIGEAERDWFWSGGHFRGANYDRSLQVALFCVLHGIMATLVYTSEALRPFSLGQVQLGVGGIKGHTRKRDVRRTRVVQGTQEHAPIALMVNHTARGLVPEWFTWTTIQLSCNVRRNPHQHRFDTTHGRRCSPLRSTWVVRSGWKREVSTVNCVTHQGEGIARTAFTVQAVDTVSVSHL